MLIGGLYTGAVSDVIGRKPMLVLSLAVNAGEMRQRHHFFALKPTYLK
jgi:MFS family permease